VSRHYKSQSRGLPCDGVSEMSDQYRVAGGPRNLSTSSLRLRTVDVRETIAFLIHNLRVPAKHPNVRASAHAPAMLPAGPFSCRYRL